MHPFFGDFQPLSAAQAGLPNGAASQGLGHNLQQRLEARLLH